MRLISYITSARLNQAMPKCVFLPFFASKESYLKCIQVFKMIPIIHFQYSVLFSPPVIFFVLHFILQTNGFTPLICKIGDVLVLNSPTDNESESGEHKMEGYTSLKTVYFYMHS